MDGMPRRRSRHPDGSHQATRQARQLGEELRLGRIGLGLSRPRRSGVSASTISRIEDGDRAARVDTLVAIGAAVGMNVVLKAYPGATPRLRDTGQLTIAQQLCSIAHATWRPRLEVAAGDYGRCADLVLYGADEIIHIEIERVAADLQAQYRLATSKRSFLASADVRPVRLVLAVEDSVRNRSALQPHDSLLRSQLPAGSRHILRAIRTGTPLGADGLLWIRRRTDPYVGKKST
jgi:hypothetical protein